MQTITRLFCASLFAMTACQAFASDLDAEVRQQWHEAISTGYQSLSSKTGELSDTAEKYCRAPTVDARDQLEQTWLDAFLAWQNIRFVDFGPIESNNLSWQFQFWPDPKNLVARKATYLLTADDPITPEVISQSGVAVQGFPMLEYLLYDQQLNASDRSLPARRACELLTRVAAHSARNSDALTSTWQAFKDHYLGTEQYRDTTIRAGMASLEILEERRLARPMGLQGTGKRNPYIADAWRSGNSLRSVEATMDGLQQLFLPGLVTLLEANEQERLAERIRSQFAEVKANFSGARLPLTTLLDDDQQFRILQGLYVDISQLAVLVNENAAVSLGVVRGFNSSDGD